MSRAFRRGWVVAITFDDHAEDSDEPVSCILYGRVTKVHRRYVVVESWANPDPDAADDDIKQFTILKSTITHWDRLVPQGGTQ